MGDRSRRSHHPQGTTSQESGLIQVTLQNTEWPTYNQQTSAPRIHAGLYAGWYPDYLDPGQLHLELCQSDASDDQGIFYSNPEMDALLLAGAAGRDLRSADGLKSTTTSRSCGEECRPSRSRKARCGGRPAGARAIVLEPDMQLPLLLDLQVVGSGCQTSRWMGSC